VLTPLVEKQIPEQAKARGITEAEVIRDVLLAADQALRRGLGDCSPDGVPLLGRRPLDDRNSAASRRRLDRPLTRRLDRP
jgi:hypothetical protein